MKESKLFKELKKLKDYKITLPLANEKNSNKNLDFNFFESYIGTHKKKKFKHLYITLIVSTLALVFLTSFIWNYIKINNTQKEIESLKIQVDSPQAKAKLNEVDKLKKKYDVLNKYYGQAYGITTAIDNKSIISSSLIEKIFSQIPKTLSFKSFNVTVGDKGAGGSIDIQGIAESRSNIAELEHNLKLVDSIKEVQVSNIAEVNSVLESKSNNNSSYTFSMKCTLKDVDENEAK
ncbi:MAG: PilN domain-containing protein [Clostridiaceae bacterium]|nr:PilN domain-containing protein [Clostridiaceae bacterium]